MLLLKPVEMPDTCYVQEAAYWVAFGRVPEFMPYEEHPDMRANLEVITSGDGNGLDWYDQGFSATEFQSCGVKIDMDRYFEARAAFYLGSFDEFMEDGKNRIASMESTLTKLQDEKDSYSDDMRAKLVDGETAYFAELRARIEVYKSEFAQEQIDVRWMLDMERRLKPMIDRGRATVFQALASGELKAFGFIETETYRAITECLPPFDKADADIPGPDELVRREEIPAHVWTWDDFNWKDSTLQTPDATYTHVQVATDDMLRAFPTPQHCQIIELACETYIYGGVVIAKDEDAPRASNRRPGRPALGCDIKTLVQNRLRVELKNNPDYAKEARETIVQDSIAYVKTYTGKVVPRSTIQSYLAPVMPETMPEKRPDNPPKMEAAE